MLPNGFKSAKTAESNVSFCVGKTRITLRAATHGFDFSRGGSQRNRPTGPRHNCFLDLFSMFFGKKVLAEDRWRQRRGDGIQKRLRSALDQDALSTGFSQMRLGFGKPAAGKQTGNRATLGKITH